MFEDVSQSPNRLVPLQKPRDLIQPPAQPHCATLSNLSGQALALICTNPNRGRSERFFPHSSLFSYYLITHDSIFSPLRKLPFAFLNFFLLLRLPLVERC